MRSLLKPGGLQSFTGHFQARADRTALTRPLCAMASAPPVKRVLSIQSHVVSGYVGNKCAVFTLQLLGFDVDPINAVHFSNHGSYPTVKGSRTTRQQLTELIEGLKANDLLHYSHLLTGYIGSADFLLEIAEVVRELRAREAGTVYGALHCMHLPVWLTLHACAACRACCSTKPSSISSRRVCAVCDPVLGDEGRLYVPEECVRVYRDTIVPLATVLTPNQYELELLTGHATASRADVFAACEQLHAAGPSTVVRSACSACCSVRAGNSGLPAVSMYPANGVMSNIISTARRQLTT